MAKPPRQSGQKVTFTPEAAQRIARAVVAVEQGSRSIHPPMVRSSGGDDSIVRGTFTAPWNKGNTKTVTDAVLSSVTYASVQNYFANVTGTGTKQCAIAYVGGEWILMAAECG